jgi:hypothetical protein
MQLFVINFVSDLRQVGGLLWVLWFTSPINLITQVVVNPTTIRLRRPLLDAGVYIGVNKRFPQPQYKISDLLLWQNG